MNDQIRADQLLPILEDLGRELQLRGLRAELYIAGGAAMSLRYASRDLTDDVDALGAAHTDATRVPVNRGGYGRFAVGVRGI